MILRQTATLAGMALVAGGLILGGAAMIVRSAPVSASVAAADPLVLAAWTTGAATARTVIDCWPADRSDELPGHAI